MIGRLAGCWVVGWVAGWLGDWVVAFVVCFWCGGFAGARQHTGQSWEGRPRRAGQAKQILANPCKP